MNAVYTAVATATGDGRNGHTRSSDGLVDHDLATPKEMGGAGGATNPEQLFAAGYAACFQGAMGLAAKELGVDAGGSTLVAEVGFGPEGESYGLAVTLRAAVPGLEREQVQQLLERTHELCPYSKATRGNIPVELVVESA